MKFIPFDLEHAQSIWEQKVEFNLTESGVHPITLNELIGDDQDLFDKLLRLEINYPHVNGIPRLRELIASLYEGAATDNVLVTVGAAEANQIIMQTLLDAGDGRGAPRDRRVGRGEPAVRTRWGFRGCEWRCG